jgi:TolB-like protein
MSLTRRSLLSLGLLLALLGCSGQRQLSRASPTRAFPRTWDGREAPKPVTQPSRPVTQPAPQAQAAAPTPGLPPPAPDSRAAGKLIAVLEFRNKLRDATEADAGYFANAIRAGLKRALPKARVMTRENVLVLLKSAGRSLADCEGECEVDTGRRLGADLVVSGDLLRLGSRFKLDLRLHDTTDGQLVSGSAATGQSVEQLDDGLATALDALLAPLK